MRILAFGVSVRAGAPLAVRIAPRRRRWEQPEDEATKVMTLQARSEPPKGTPRSRAAANRARFSLLVYNQSCEDPRPDLEGLAPGPGNRIFTIASGGCNVLHLAMTGAHVIAVDRNAAQIALTEAKVEAARRLDPAVFRDIFSTGRDIGHALVDLPLSHRSRELLRTKGWFRGTGLFASGVLGRAGRLLRLWIKLAGAEGAVAASFAAPTLEAQAAQWSVAWHRLSSWPGGALLRTSFPLLACGVPLRVARQIPGSSRGVADGVDQVMRSQPAASNWFWQQMMLGEYRTAYPPYLENDLRGLGPITLCSIDLLSSLRGTPTASLDGAALLDVMHWFADRHRVGVWAELHRVLRRGARVTVRQFNSETAPPGELFSPESLESVDMTGCYEDAAVYVRR